ncbi:MAG: hypothetical protein AAFR59_15455, partial [Bacteroidota bacterium]
MKTLIHIFWIFLLFIPSLALAQLTIQEGYIIDLEGHKVPGQVKVQNWEQMQQEVQFHPKSQGGFRSYTLSDIQGYGFSDFHYVKRKAMIPEKDLLITNAEEQEVFLLICNEGTLDLYEYRIGTKKIYYLESDDLALTPLIYKLEPVEGVQIDFTAAMATFPNGKVIALNFEEDVQRDAFGQIYILDEDKKILTIRKNEGVNILYGAFDQLNELHKIEYPREFKMRHPMIANSVDKVNLQVDSSKSNIRHLQLRKQYIGLIGAMAF